MAVAVNDRVRVEHGADGGIVVMAAWCGKCKCEVMPVGDGSCPWCGSRIVDESQLSASAMLSQLRNREQAGLEETAAVGQTAVSGAAAVVGEPERAAASSSPKPGPVEPAPTPEGEERPAAGGGASERGRGELQADVVRALSGGEKAASEIAAAVGKADARGISGTLITLTKKGLVERVAYGVYGLTDAGREALATGASLAGKRPPVVARPEDSEREPQAEEDVADVGSALERPVSPPPPAGEEAASRSAIDPPQPDVEEPEETTAVTDDDDPLAVLKLIRELDDGTLTITRWKENGDGDQDAEDELFVRQLARTMLDGWTPIEIGQAILASLDPREAA